MFASSARVSRVCVCVRTPSRAPRDKWHVCKTTHGAAHWGGERRYHRCRVYLRLDLNIRHRATPLIGIFWELSTSLNYDHLMFLHSARARKRLIVTPSRDGNNHFLSPFFSLPPPHSVLASSLVRSHSSFFPRVLIRRSIRVTPPPHPYFPRFSLPFPSIVSHVATTTSWLRVCSYRSQFRPIDTHDSSNVYTELPCIPLISARTCN